MINIQPSMTSNTWLMAGIFSAACASNPALQIPQESTKAVSPPYFTSQVLPTMRSLSSMTPALIVSVEDMRDLLPYFSAVFAKKQTALLPEIQEIIARDYSKYWD